MRDASYYISRLHMEKHPEGGYFFQSYVGEEKVGERPIFSSIYFLLQNGEVSHFHRLKEDELWYYHDGNSLNIYVIDEQGKLEIVSLGPDLASGERLQYLVKKNCIFASAMKREGFSLVGCMVAPAFTYDHFELFTKEQLTKLYPEHVVYYDELALS